MNKIMDIALSNKMASKNAVKNNQKPNEVNFVKGNKFTHKKSTKKMINQHYSKNFKKDQASENWYLIVLIFFFLLVINKDNP